MNVLAHSAGVGPGDQCTAVYGAQCTNCTILCNAQTVGWTSGQYVLTKWGWTGE